MNFFSLDDDIRHRDSTEPKTSGKAFNKPFETNIQIFDSDLILYGDLNIMKYDIHIHEHSNML